METFLAIIAIILIIAGLIGCFIPVLPGPPLAYMALLLAQLGPKVPFSFRFMLIVGLVVIVVTILDYMIPALGAKKWGGSRYGVIGALVGVLVSFFIFPPFGILLFPLLGAILGEYLKGSGSDKALKAGLGTVVGLLFGTMLKFSVTLIIAYYFFTNL
jgi:uncharacterized protein YqgC (DUF456 family)